MSKKLSRFVIRLTILARFIVFLWHSGSIDLIILFFLTVIGGLLPVIIAWFTKSVIDSITAIHAAPVINVHDAYVFLIIECALALALVVTDQLVNVWRRTISLNFDIKLNSEILNKVIKLPLLEIENPLIQNKISSYKNFGGTKAISIVNDLLQIFRAMFTVTGYALILASYQPFYIVLVIAAVIPYLLLEGWQAHVLFRSNESKVRLARRSNYLESLLINQISAKEIKSFNIEKHILLAYKKVSQKISENGIQDTRRAAKIALICGIIANLFFYFCYFDIASLAIHKSISLGSMILFIQALRSLQNSLVGVSSSTIRIFEGLMHFEGIFDFINQECNEIYPQISPTKKTTGITFSNVCFKYIDSERYILNKLTFTINPGKIVAIVGRNGSGKSTLAKVLAGLYKPTSGFARIDGIDCHVSRESVSGPQVSVLFQDYNKYQFTLRQNIVLNFGENTQDCRLLHDVINASKAGGLVDSLVNGVDTHLGRWLESGVELSSGEWQKVAIARAFYCNQKYVILDEPTANLDPVSERDILINFRKMGSDRTLIFICHSAAAAKVADEIFVIDDGRIVEHGPHDVLFNSNGHYWSLFKSKL